MVSWLNMRRLSNGEKLCAVVSLFVLLPWLGRKVVVAVSGEHRQEFDSLLWRTH
jgi:hypothetical protein